MSNLQKRVPLSRRDALSRIGNGFGMVAFAGLVNNSQARAGVMAPASGALSGRALDYAPRVKRVIFLFMNGGLSHIDSFDRKPALETYRGESLRWGGDAGLPPGALMPSPFTWNRHGQSGIEISELFSHLGGVADDICWIRSAYTDRFDHEPAMLMMNTGSDQAGHPALGSWLTYGLGTENQNLPGFVVLCPDVPTTVGPPLWSNGFLPAINQGSYVRDKVQERQTDDGTIGKEFNPKSVSDVILPGDGRVNESIQSMEATYRMQTEAAEVFDIRKESTETQKMYGPGSTARGCLMAVRLAERGVRMVQVYYAKGDPWDAHVDIQAHRKNAKDSDQPFAAVVKDLKGRGMWEDTLVVCGSEFGRSPIREEDRGRATNGRGHNPSGFTMWLAGGAVKGGTIYGATDDFGCKAVDKPLHVHDLHATILYLMGIDHTKLTYPHRGKNLRFTGVAGKVVRDICA
jgi:hypothetical protein